MLFRCRFVIAVTACLSAYSVAAQTGEVLARQVVAEGGFQGGLIVLVGGHDVELAVSLGKAPNVLIHWLVRESAGLEDVRREIREAGVYGRVSAMAWEGSALPYADGMVNLLLLEEDGRLEVGQPEAARVVAPMGATMQLRNGARIGSCDRKPWPQDVDEWTHSRRDATGNAVSRDGRAGPPQSVQWEAIPRWNRGTKTSALVSESILVALVNASDTADFWRNLNRDMRIVAVRPATGELLWDHAANPVLPMTLTADGRQVIYHDGRSIRSLDLRTGSPRWTSPPTGQAIVLRDSSNPDSPGAEKLKIILAPQFAPTMVIYGDVVAFAGGRQLNVVSADDGRELWRSAYTAGNYSVPADLFGFDGAFWGPDTEMNFWRPASDDIAFKAYEPLTGTVSKSVSGSYNFRFQHHRCHQMKVIGSTIVAARAGIEFMDTVTGSVKAHHWVRGSCYFGVLPANGLLYIPPHDCACYIRAKLSGFMALNARPSSATPLPIPEDRRLQRGPAYNTLKTQNPVLSEAEGSELETDDDWPTYRRDAARSGKATTEVASELVLGWHTELGGNLTSPVVANGRLFLGSTDEHVLYALRADTGELLWQYSFDARIDSPPTVHDGLVLTGCRDGSVVALRATDGTLVWRFLAAPEQRMIVSRGQLESVWPVHGSVLVVDNTVYFAAGRSSYLDGGLRLYGLEPHSGRKVAETVLNSRQDDGSETLDEEAVDGFLNDVLSSDGEHLFMRHQVLDKAGKPQTGRITHLHGPDGYLSSDTTSRLIWTYAPLYTSPHQGAFYDVRLSRTLFPSGRILVEGDNTIYGFGQNHYAKMRTDPGGTFALFACPKQSDVPLDRTAKEYRSLALAGKHQVRFNWWKTIPIHAWAMVKTEDILFVAGARGSESVSQDALEGKEPGVLLAVSPADGTVLAETPLPSMPVWDGMAAARGDLYITLADGGAAYLRVPTSR